MPYKDRERNLAYQRERNRKRYLEHHDEELARLKLSNDARQVRMQSMVDAIKGVPCADCGYSFPPVCMDFDHTGDDKTASIANMVGNGRPKCVILEEILKCEVVCANCHRLRTKSRWAKPK